MTRRRGGAAAVRGGVSGEAEAARSAAGGGKQWRRAWILATSMACEARALRTGATKHGKKNIVGEERRKKKIRRRPRQSAVLVD